MNENNNYIVSRNCCEYIIDCIKSKKNFSIELHMKYIQEAIKEKMENENSTHFNKLQELRTPENESTWNYLSLSDSSWLSANPSYDNNTILTKDEFKILLFLRYNLPVPNLPKICDGCGKPFTVEHALIYKKGGLIIARHDHLKYEIANLFNNILPSSQIKIEPKLLIAENEKDEDRLVGDISVKDIWNDDRTSILIYK